MPPSEAPSIKVEALDAAKPVVVLAGLHGGCYEQHTPRSERSWRPPWLLDDRTWLVQVLARMGHVRRQTGDLDGAIAAGLQALELAAELGKSTLQMHASYYLGQAYFAIGDFGRAAELAAVERGGGGPRV